MHKALSSSLKITFILYFIILMLPVNFYFVYTSFKTMQYDTKIVRQSSWAAGGIEYLAVKHDNQNDLYMMERIDKILPEISLWVVKNSDSTLYIGTQSLSKDFLQVTSCWDSYKEVLAKNTHIDIMQQSLQCYKHTDYMAIMIEKMVYLKQNKIINIFYLNLAITMILILLVIYMVRAYIHKQIKKHAIHDHESKLFNKKYFMAELKTTCSRSARHNYPLSILRVSINDFEKENKTYSRKVKRNTLKVFGILMHSLVRDGDIASRYDDNHFLILLPFTEEENALLLEERIEQALKKDKWMTSQQITFEFNTTEFDKKESEEALILRTLA